MRREKVQKLWNQYRKYHVPHEMSEAALTDLSYELEDMESFGAGVITNYLSYGHKEKTQMDKCLTSLDDMIFRLNKIAPATEKAATEKALLKQVFGDLRKIFSCLLWE